MKMKRGWAEIRKQSLKYSQCPVMAAAQTINRSTLKKNQFGESHKRGKGGGVPNGRETQPIQARADIPHTSAFHWDCSETETRNTILRENPVGGI